MKKLSHSIQLLQGYYHFLYIGKFVENLIKYNDLSTMAEDFEVPTGPSQSFKIKGKTISSLLTQIYKQPEKRNLFGYMIEINARRGVFSITRELLQETNDFQRFVKKLLGKQYFAFEQVIMFARNVLTHSTDTEFTIDYDDIQGQKVFLKEHKRSLITFEFKYSDFVPDRKGNKDYGIAVSIDFSKLKAGKKLSDIIRIHDLYLLVELCYNLCTLYRKK